MQKYREHEPCYKEWSFLWIGDPVLEEEEEDVFEADSHGWSQEVWVLLPHLSGFSCSLRYDQERGAATSLTEIFFFSFGQWGMVILLFEIFWFTKRGVELCSARLESCCSKQRCSTWQGSQASACESLTVSGTLCQTQLLPSHSWFLAWDQFLPRGNDLADLATSSVSLQLCSGAGAPGSMSSSLLAEVWKQETRFLR